MSSSLNISTLDVRHEYVGLKVPPEAAGIFPPTHMGTYLNMELEGSGGKFSLANHDGIRAVRINGKWFEPVTVTDARRLSNKWDKLGGPDGT